MLPLALVFLLAPEEPREVAPVEFLTSPEALELRIDSAQRRVLVGEPLRLSVTWIQKRAGYVDWADEDFANQSLALAVHDGKTLRLYRESPHVTSIEGRYVSPSPAGTTMRSDLTFFSGRDYVGPGPDRSQWNQFGVRTEEDTSVFPAKGKYRLWAVLLKETGEPTQVRSNELAFTVDEPSVAEQKVLSVLREAPERFRGMDHSRDDSLTSVIARNPQSPYLRWARLKRLRQDLRRTGQGSNPAERRAERQAFLRSKAQETMSDNWGPFEDLALDIADELATAADDAPLKQQIRKRLLSRFPDSPAARRVREEAQ
jgi:hypothetical protein